MNSLRPLILITPCIIPRLLWTCLRISYPVARWPHGCRRKYSEVAVPMLVGSNPTEGGGFFQRKEPPPGHGCVCMSIRG
jgi:hypothetical protein